MFQKLIAALALITVALIGASNPAHTQDAESEMQKAVLVTGASTGIGRNIAETLAAAGYFVYAGARKQADLDALNDIENIQAIRLDVTKQDEIDAAVEIVRAGGKGLYGLVNNAGVLTSGPLTEIDESDVAWVMDINVMGVYRITKAFAPLIMESEGRITNISSIAGVLTAPFFGPYSMSKHALEAYTDTLADEMALFNVKVSAVNPGNYRSKIGNKEAAAVAAQPYAQPGSPYAEAIAEHIEYMADRSMHKEPDDVSSAVMDALFSESPKPNYMVVPNEEEASWTIGRMIQEMAEFNADQEFTYSDEELIEMMQAATAAQRK
jgi:NAD(P)-dependent dehydrogenase (short-subunit alcohol dehydrogenase family)